jgi:hypothetical protein
VEIPNGGQPAAQRRSFERTPMTKIATVLATSLLLSATTANAGPMGWKCGQTEVWLWVDTAIIRGCEPKLGLAGLSNSPLF